MRASLTPRHYVARLVFVAAVLTAPAVPRAETPVPAAPARWLTDNVGFLSPAVRNEIDKRLGDYARVTGHQVVVYIGLTTDGVPIEDWAVKAFQQWRVGRKGVDDGLGLFIFSADRKLRIEVGYGLEPIMTDTRASRIIREVIVPRIRDGDRDGAVRAGVDAILATLTTATDVPIQAPARRRLSPEDKRTLWIVALGFLAIPVVLLALAGIVVIWPRGRRQLSTPPGWRAGESAGDARVVTESSDSPAEDGFSGGGGRSGGGGASGSW